jgi:hypothetical protein
MNEPTHPPKDAVRITAGSMEMAQLGVPVSLEGRVTPTASYGREGTPSPATTTTATAVDPVSTSNGKTPSQTTPSTPPPAAYSQPRPASSSKPRVYSSKTISSYIAQHPDRSPAQAIKHHFPRANPVTRLIRRFKVKHSVIEGLNDKEFAKWELMGPETRRKAGWYMEGEEDTEGKTLVSPLFWKVGGISRRAKMTLIRRRCTSLSFPHCKETLCRVLYLLISLDPPPPCPFRSSHLFQTSCDIIAMSLFVLKKRYF